MMKNNMYLVALSGHRGYDTVAWINDPAYKAGDLLQDSQGLYLCLGKELVFPELYPINKKQPYTIAQSEKIYTKFLSTKTLDLIHRMVQQYFSSYKNVCDLFIPEGIEKKLPEKKTVGDQEQSCIIFPDLWTLTQHYPLNKEDPHTAILHGGMTLVQKRKLFSLIRSGEVHTLLSTNRGLFFEWNNLKHITIYQASNRAYSAQSDPRFVLQDVVEKIGKLYGATIYYST